MSLQPQGDKDFQYGLFGCLGDKPLCLMTFCCPCYTVGKNAQGMGEDCLLHGLLSGLGLYFGPLIRWRLRQRKDIKGTMLMDVLVHGVCMCCALVQDAREMGLDGKTVNEFVEHNKKGAIGGNEPEAPEFVEHNKKGAIGSSEPEAAEMQRE